MGSDCQIAKKSRCTPQKCRGIDKYIKPGNLTESILFGRNDRFSPYEGPMTYEKTAKPVGVEHD